MPYYVVKEKNTYLEVYTDGQFRMIKRESIDNLVQHYVFELNSRNGNLMYGNVRNINPEFESFNLSHLKYRMPDSFNDLNLFIKLQVGLYLSLVKNDLMLPNLLQKGYFELIPFISKVIKRQEIKINELQPNQSIAYVIDDFTSEKIVQKFYLFKTGKTEINNGGIRLNILPTEFSNCLEFSNLLGYVHVVNDQQRENISIQINHKKCIPKIYPINIDEIKFAKSLVPEKIDRSFYFNKSKMDILFENVLN